MISLLQSIFTNAGLFIFGILLLSVPVATFLDAYLLDAEKRQLRHKFEAWWVTIVDQDKLVLALIIANKFSIALDRFFGERLFSSRAFFKGLLVATGLLISSLALIGIVNHKSFGIQPWSDYRQTASLINGISSNTLASIRSTNAVKQASQITVTNSPIVFTNKPSLLTTNLQSNTQNNLQNQITPVTQDFEKSWNDWFGPATRRG